MPFALIMLAIAIIVACYIWFLRTDDSLIAPVAVAVLSVVVIGLILYSDYNQTETRTVVIEGKDRGADDGSYRVYTDGDTLSIKDVLINGSHRRTNSADFYGDIRVCHRYEVVVRGWESGFFSEMPNIVEATDLGPVEECVPRD